MPTPTELLKQSQAEALLSSRISGNKNSYKKDNPAEYQSVLSYLQGGARPDVSALTHMGLHLVYLQDAYLALQGPSPVPPPNSAISVSSPVITS